MSDQTVFENFVLAINSHDANVISNYLSDDHIFIDAAGKKISGKDEVKKGWETYLKMFPDYQIIINSFNDKATVWLAEGTAEGTYRGISTVSGDNHFKIPAAWKAVIENGKVKSWQVFADTKIVNDIIFKYSSQTSGQVSDNEKVTGFGGVFMKSKDPKALGEWYNKYLGTTFGKESYMMFEWSEKGNPNSKASTTFGIFSEKSKYFEPSTKEFMLNFRVRNLKSLLERLKTEGVNVIDKYEEYDYGNFGWIMDIDGNKIELWEPKE
jgi:predicted enzyme related to lactoylglutathione lyase